MAGETYSIVTVQDTIYLDSGKPIQGKLVLIRFQPWNEIIEFRVPNATPQIIKPVAEDWIDNRIALDELGT